MEGPFSRETDLTRNAPRGGPITDEDRLFIHRLSNPEQSDLERVIRADERRRVAEEIAQAIEHERDEGDAFMFVASAEAASRAAAIAREFATKGAERG
ncbi:MAG TPA: hypothetical protein VHA75_02605 [Rugosimonospora sp.]|nr:hypothetical protein [Rugosimonospora sp.]